MSRLQIIVLSVMCCAFGVVALSGPVTWRGWAYGVNVALAVVLFVVAGRDLTQRG